MTITITLPSATEQRLRAQAAATGKDLATLVVEAVEAKLAVSPSIRQILKPIHDEVRRSGIGEPELDSLLTDELKAVRAERQSKSEKNG